MGVSKIQLIRSSLLAFLWVFAGCANFPMLSQDKEISTTAEQSGEQSQDTKDIEYANLPKESLTATLLFDLLLGEIAGQRGRIDVSGPSYLQAAHQSNDPRVAERAFKIALYGKDQGQALDAGKRWIELVPENKAARQAVAALALRSGSTAYAIEQLDYLVTYSQSSDEDTYKGITAILLREPDKKRTLELASKLVADKPDDLHVRLMHAHLAVNADDWGLAEKEINHILVQRPDWVQPIIMRAQIQYKNEQTDLAIKQLKAALDRNPKSFELRMGYARLLVDARELGMAKTQFKKLRRSKPENGQVIYSLALITMGEQQLNEAAGYFKKLVAMDFQKQLAYYYLGVIAEKQEAFTQATQWYTKVESGEHLLEAQIRLASIDAETGKINEARGRLKNLRLTQPVHVQRLLLVEGELLVNADLFEQAFELYSVYLLALPTDIEVRYARSLLAEKMDRLEQAENDFKEILVQDPENVRALNAYGYTLADRTGRYQEAYEFVKKALDQTPDDPAVMDSMGWVQFKLGDLQAARKFLAKAYDETHDAEIAAHLGEVLWSLGEKEAAIKLWDAGKKVDPENAVLVDTIQRLKH